MTGPHDTKIRNGGWIKLHRSVLDNPISRKPAYNHLWTILLLLASHNKQEFIWGGQKVTLNPGQFTTGRKKLSKLSGLHESSIQRILKYLEIEHQIEQQTFNRFRIITIKNWDKYQSQENSEHKAEHTSEQQANTFNKDRRRKKNIPPEDFISYWNSKGNLPQIKVFADGRKRQLKTRSQEPHFFENWKKIIDKLRASPFHTGQNGRRWKATCDWILQNDSNYCKIMELPEESETKDTEPVFDQPSPEYLENYPRCQR